MSISNIIEEHNNLLAEYDSLKKENKDLKEKLYKPDKTFFNMPYETDRDVRTWNNGFVAAASVMFIGDIIGMIISTYL